MPLDWDDLKVLLAVGRTGSLSGAAALLGIDQSTAGRRVSALEADLGAILFVRSKTGFTPTEYGEIAIARAIEIEIRALRLTEEIARPSQGPSGLVRLHGNGWMLARLVAHAMPALLERHPRLDIRIVSGLVSRGLPHGEPAIALWFETPPQSGEFAVKLGEMPYALYGPRGVDPDRLGWVAFWSPLAAQRSPSRWSEGSLKPGEAQRLTATDASVLQAAVRAGLGKCLLPMCLAEGDDALARIGAGPPDVLRTVHLHAHPDTIQTARIQATMAWLRESFATVFLPAAPPA